MRENRIELGELTLAVADFSLFHGRTIGNPHTGTVLNDAWNTVAYADAWNEFVFNAAGKAALLDKENDTFKMAMISSKDYSNTAPGDTNYVTFETSEVAEKEPYISLTFVPRHLVNNIVIGGNTQYNY
ncbi:hypothetical protein ES705_44557 [subsurface metagenome]